MTKEYKWFLACMVLVFIVGFLSGVLAAPRILHSFFSPPGIAGHGFGGPGFEGGPGGGGPPQRFGEGPGGPPDLPGRHSPWPGGAPAGRVVIRS